MNKTKTMAKQKKATKEPITTFEEACAQQGLDPNKVIPDMSCMPEQDRTALVAHAKMCIIQRSLNGDWVPDWGDNDQYKYYPWFDVIKKEEGPSGFGLSFYGFGYGDSDSSLCARLYFKDRETARYAGETFIDLYEDMILIPR